MCDVHRTHVQGRDRRLLMAYNIIIQYTRMSDGLFSWLVLMADVKQVHTYGVEFGCAHDLLGARALS